MPGLSLKYRHPKARCALAAWWHAKRTIIRQWHLCALALALGSCHSDFKVGDLIVTGDIAYPQADIELVITAVTQQLGPVSGEVRFCTDCLDEGVNGWAWDTGVWVRPLGDCVMQSALAHELIHLYQNQNGVRDYNHKAQGVWGQGNEGSLMWRLGQSITPMVCSPSEYAAGALIVK